MIVEMWALGIKLDLYDKSNIKHVLQINDIADLKDRQASYTNSFNIPKTANNCRAFDALGTTSDTSRIPYMKPNCIMKIEGFDFITSGWLNITETAEDYKIYVYSGIINFFKAVENKTLGDLDLKEIEHTKNVQTVVGSFSNSAYRYLLADYNGLTHYGDNGEIINIDYLVPSVNVKYIWDKIHSSFSYTYSGEVFDSEKFKNLWLTYPKPISIDEIENLIDSTGSRLVNFTGNAPSYWRGIPIEGLQNSTFFVAPQTANYRVFFRVENDFNGANTGYPVRYYMSTNQEDIPYQNRVGARMLKEIPANAGAFDVEIVIQLNKGDVISFYDFYEMNGQVVWRSNFKLKLDLILPGGTSFSTELRDFSITDFIKEILNMFCLTVFPSEFTPGHLKYLSFGERVKTAKTIDWSRKYLKRTSEKYKLDGYAQKNSFKYQYSDKEEVYHDGDLEIADVNLPERAVAFSSKTYSPEIALSDFFVGSAGSRSLRVFKLYDKNIKESKGEKVIEYRGLEKRFHFARAEPISSNVVIGSKVLTSKQEISSFYIASFSGLSWGTLISENYKEIMQVLNDTRICQIQLNLNIIDFLDFDFNSLIYFEQEQQFYIPNKLEIDYDTGQAAGEFIRLKKEKGAGAGAGAGAGVPTPGNSQLSIFWGDETTEAKSGFSDSEILKIASLEYSSDEIVSFEWERFDGITWTGLGTGVTPTVVILKAGIQKFRLKGTSAKGSALYSNELQYTRLSYVCKRYYAWSWGSSGDELSVYFQNCEGQWEQLSTRAGSGTQSEYLDLSFCAVENTVSIQRGTLEDKGMC